MLSPWIFSILALSLGLVASIAIPTASQLAYQEAEIGAIIHFSSNTYAELQGCDSGNWFQVSDSSVFQPTELDVDSWLEAAAGFGAKYAVLTAKHQCGFCLWPSNATIKSVDGQTFRYNYSVAYSSWAKGQEDVVKKFIQSCKKYGIRPGLYYSVNDNEFLKIQAGALKNDTKLNGQVSVSVADYQSLVLTQLNELWSTYIGGVDNEPLEIWFDGGYPQELQSSLIYLIDKVLPLVCVFNGYGITKNPVRWCGTEDGYAPDPNWSAGTSSGGDPDSPVFNPAEVDYTLQQIDQWFYIKAWPIHNLTELITVYHRSVGLNANMLLDIAVPPSGKVDDQHMVRYKEFGVWLQSCYGGAPLGLGVGSGLELNFTMLNKTANLVDRIILRENQKSGQKVRNFAVSVYSNGEWSVVKQGQSIGHKRIILLGAGKEIEMVKVTLDVEQTIYAEARLCSNNGIEFLEE